MSHDIADKLRAMLAEVEGNTLPATVQDVTDEFRRHMLPKMKHNSGAYNRFYNLLLLLEDEYCDQPAKSFGPVKLAEIRKHFIKAGNCRKYVNEQTRNVIRIFKFGVARELIDGDQLVSLKSLEPLKFGEAPEGKRKTSVTLEQVAASLPHLSHQLQAMVRIQVGTGMRPSEIFAMTPAQIDRSGDVWFYRPERHKTASHGVRKAVPLVGDAREAIKPYLLRGESTPCFQTWRGNQWNRNSYRTEIQKACVRAGVAKWSPYAIRHLAAQVVRERAGLDAAKHLLGHTSSVITEAHYAAISERESVAAAMVAPSLQTSEIA